MKASQGKPTIELNDEEKKRLVAYFNVLIEMDLELKKLRPKELHENFRSKHNTH